MFISPPNNFNQSPMWNTDSSSLETPMTPMPKFGMNDDSRQGPMPGASTTSQTPTTTQDFDLGPTSPIVNNPLYNQGWLKSQIGKYIRVDFLLGTNTFQDRQGLLQEVGISFIVLKESSTNNLIMCDIYSIKFVTVFGNQNQIPR
ncbi:hypothetical protein [Clostridium estertheticum]|uniref:hypothetical protein n=1 Tax=Clostridium estertheticum TaxID=238834 RepID=UPI001C0B79BC|nr:hypothetical protein [Clostridium estertheticum]MBU3072225.1 hypothetical protein [Clostridium estertheticum]MBU3162317.1 hypothetical protein [Clostridium estertheticum]MBU3170748.1 hypothetical protein [Clostridium estertheticum]MBU3184621.1 hypothetical protein [Clostridium estertheticum]